MPHLKYPNSSPLLRRGDSSAGPRLLELHSRPSNPPRSRTGNHHWRESVHYGENARRDRDTYFRRRVRSRAHRSHLGRTKIFRQRPATKTPLSAFSRFIPAEFRSAAHFKNTSNAEPAARISPKPQ